jgi:hypothetical protein
VAGILYEHKLDRLAVIFSASTITGNFIVQAAYAEANNCGIMHETYPS